MDLETTSHCDNSAGSQLCFMAVTHSAIVVQSLKSTSYVNDDLKEQLSVNFFGVSVVTTVNKFAVQRESLYNRFPPLVSALRVLEAKELSEQT